MRRGLEKHGTWQEIWGVPGAARDGRLNELQTELMDDILRDVERGYYTEEFEAFKKDWGESSVALFAENKALLARTALTNLLKGEN